MPPTRERPLVQRRTSGGNGSGGKRPKQRPVGMVRHQLGDPLIESVDLGAINYREWCQR